MCLLQPPPLQPSLHSDFLVAIGNAPIPFGPSSTMQVWKWSDANDAFEYPIEMLKCRSQVDLPPELYEIENCCQIHPLLSINKQEMSSRLLVAALLALASSLASAADPSPLQDFCVSVNGFGCKNPNTVTADDFFLSGLHKLGNTANQLGSAVTPATVGQIAGLNTLGVSMARIDYAPKGVIPPHIHPRANEVLTVLEGTLNVGFVDSTNKLFTKILNKGDVYVFPQGLVHFQFNVGKSNAVSISGLGSQNPGVVTVANAVFGSDPSISADALAKAFKVDKKVIEELQAMF